MQFCNIFKAMFFNPDVLYCNIFGTGMVGELLRALGRLEEHPEEEENDGTFAEHQTKVLQQCEAIASAAHDMVR